MSVSRTAAAGRGAAQQHSAGSSPAKRRSPLAPLLRTASRVYNVLRLSTLPSHRTKVRAASRALKCIRSFRGEAIGARVFSYLRKVDPTVFEEMVLTALQDGGRLVRRNKRYTGDGGSDGAFYEPGTGWLQVQSKRYGSHISAEHVRDFSALIGTTNCVGGIFVHTGKTGAGAWMPARGESSRVVMVSGAGLIGLLLRGDLP